MNSLTKRSEDLNSEEREIIQAMYESQLESENIEIHSEINELNVERNVHEAEIRRLKEEKAALTRIQNAGCGTRQEPVFVSKFLEDFSVVKILGEGGFGCVFEAENRYDDCKYAVKRVAVDSSKTTTQRALGEVRAMAQLDHPHIIRYNSTWIEEPPEGWQYESDVEMLKRIGSSARRLKRSYRDDCAFIYIQMQMCKYSLSKWLEDNILGSSRSIPRMKSWFKQIVSAVAFIHEKNLIHRDLKPSNILFADDDILKICDLGIATERRVDDGVETAITRTNIGTVLYMSPEQHASALKYSSKADVFALGLIFAELCIVMTLSERQKIFDNYRRGVLCDLIEDKKTADFIAKITRVDPKHRLSCREMLDHLYLS